MFDGYNWELRTHFEQIYDRAAAAAANALAALDFASQADQQLQHGSDDTYALQVEALRQDIDYRNRLIEIFGTPYEGTIGPGQLYPEGYVGPDTVFYQYIDHVDWEDFLPGSAAEYTTISGQARESACGRSLNYYISTNFVQVGKVSDLYNDYYLSQEFGTIGLPGSGANNILPGPGPGHRIVGLCLPGTRRMGAARRFRENPNPARPTGLGPDRSRDLGRPLLATTSRTLQLKKQRLDTEIDLQKKKLANRAVYQVAVRFLTTIKQDAEDVTLIGTDAAARTRGETAFANEGFPQSDWGHHQRFDLILRE